MDPSPLLAIPLEVWDRILFWMSLLPADVANFAKSSVLCHFLAFGPVGDRNEYNVLQHRALAPIGDGSQLDSVENWHAALVQASKMSKGWCRDMVCLIPKPIFTVLMRADLSVKQVGLLARLLQKLGDNSTPGEIVYDLFAAIRFKIGEPQTVNPVGIHTLNRCMRVTPLTIAALVAESRFDWLSQIELERLRFLFEEAMRSGDAEVLRWLLGRFEELAGDGLASHHVDSDLMMLENNPGLTPEVFATVLEWFGKRVPYDRLRLCMRKAFLQLQSPEGQPFLDAAGPVLQQSDDLQLAFSSLISATTMYACWWWACYAVEHDLKLAFHAVTRGLHIGCELRQVAADAGQEEERARASRVIFHLAFRTRLVGTPRGFARLATTGLTHWLDDPEEFNRRAEFMFDGEAVAPIHTVLRMLMIHIDDHSRADAEAHTSTVINGLKPYL
jgi:hypothetical protein